MESADTNLEEETQMEIESDPSTIQSDSGQAGSSTKLIWTSRRSQRRSWVWRHGNAVVDKGKRSWQCKLCRTNPKRYTDGSIKHPIEHLKGHILSESGPIIATNAIQQAFGTSSP